jgi:hypothetical protein
MACSSKIVDVVGLFQMFVAFMTALIDGGLLARFDCARPSKKCTAKFLAATPTTTRHSLIPIRFLR